MVVEARRTPFTSAHVVLVCGDQGQGKSVTGVARVVDAWNRDAVGNYLYEILHVDGWKVLTYDKVKRIAKLKKNGEIKYVHIPKEYKLHSDIRIFANFHIYGIPFVFCPSIAQIIIWLHDGTIRDGYLLIDEYYIVGNARDSMTAVGKEIEKYSFQFRKRHLEVIIMCPLERLADWTMTTIVTERIVCSYDERTEMVTCDIKKKGVRKAQSVTYWARQYFSNYWTDELILPPDSQVNSALRSLSGVK